MAQKQEKAAPFTGLGLGTSPDSAANVAVLVLVIYRDGKPTAAVHRTERGAREAAADLLDDEDGTLEDRFVRAQRLLSDEGGVMQIIPSPVFSG